MTTFKCCLKLAGFFSVMACCACSSVTTKDPLPLSAKAVQEDKNRFEGIWFWNDDGGGDALAIQIAFSETGPAHIGILGWEENEFKLIKGELILAQGENRKYFSCRIQEDGEWPEAYFFVEHKFVNGGDLVIWIPKPEFFSKATEDGKIQGTVKGGDSILTSSPEELLKFIEAAPGAEAFDYTEPLILRKLTKTKKSE